MSEPMVLRFQRMALDNETSTSDLLLAGVAHPVVQRRMQRFVDRLHAPQQQLFQQVYRQQFGIAPRPLPASTIWPNSSPKRACHCSSGRKKPVWAKIVGQLSHSCQ